MRLFVHITILCIFAAIAVIPCAPTQIDLAASLLAPSLSHLLGTDQVGRDIFVRLHEAIAHTVLPLWGLVLLSHVVAILLVGTYLSRPQLRHWLRPLGFPALGLTSLPLGVFIFFLAVAMEEASTLVVYLGMFMIFTLRTSFYLLDRRRLSQNLQYWQSFEAIGGGAFSRYLKYGICQDWKEGLLGLLSLHLQIALVTEASLSYLGFGIQEPQPSFGNMLSSHFDLALRGHALLFTCVALAVVLCAQVPASAKRLLGLF